MGTKYEYVIIGGGLAGASALAGIREVDPRGEILLITGESDLPYDRPPLSKKLWFGKMTMDKVFLNPESYYSEGKIEVLLKTHITAIDPDNKTVTTDQGIFYSFKKLLLATGGTPRSLTIPGGNIPGIYYYRTLSDYKRLREEATPGKTALIIGGGFIGSELAAALFTNKVGVTMVFPEKYFVQNVFPDYMGAALVSDYKERGVKVLAEDLPVRIEKKGEKLVTVTKQGKEITSDIIIAGIGIVPAVDLAKNSGLTLSNGIVCDSLLRTSHSDIFAAGDNCNFESIALAKRMRVEHWDAAKEQGKQAGRNMAGANEKFDYVPYFFSDLFDFGYESAGEISSALDTIPVWKEKNRTGVIYYLSEEVVRGIMLCNVWDKISEAKKIVRARKSFTKKELETAIGF